MNSKFYATLQKPINDSTILHPITLNLIENQKTKSLTLPYGSGSTISDQKYFTNEITEISTNHMELFHSDAYFFKIMFNTYLFDEILENIEDMITDANTKPTLEYILDRFKTLIINISESQKDKLINLYTKFYLFYDGVSLTYSEVFNLLEKNFKI